jgi:hypothetical protein
MDGRGEEEASREEGTGAESALSHALQKRFPTGLVLLPYLDLI